MQGFVADAADEQFSLLLGRALARLAAEQFILLLRR